MEEIERDRKYKYGVGDDGKGHQTATISTFISSLYNDNTSCSIPLQLKQISTLNPLQWPISK
jgi:hypothetical protein